MSQTATTALAREIADAGRSLFRLARFDPAWPIGLDLSAGGFVRSFFAPLLALPFNLVFAGLITSDGGTEPLTARALWGIAIAHLFNTFAFPAVVAIIARPLGFAAGYAAFIIVTNWASLFANVAMAALSPLTLLGQGGFDALGIFWMATFAASIYVTWRAARSTLSPDIAPALLMIVLSVAIGLGADQAGALLVRVIS